MKKLLTISVMAFASLTANATAQNDLMELHKEAYKLGGKIYDVQHAEGVSEAQKAQLIKWGKAVSAVGTDIEINMNSFPR